MPAPTFLLILPHRIKLTDMKTLYLLRHGKSSWEEAGKDDHDRSLLDKGVQKTALIADYLSGKSEIPQLVICSTAKRARQTLKVLSEKLGIRKKAIIYDKALYEKEADDFFELLCQADDATESVMLVGHNPSISEFAAKLCRCIPEEMPTSSVFALELHCDHWQDAISCRASKKFLNTPKMLGKE